MDLGTQANHHLDQLSNLELLVNTTTDCDRPAILKLKILHLQWTHMTGQTVKVTLMKWKITMKRYHNFY